jgi:ubiquinone/menaquinone biosynthesis C-methylase UbiE
MAETWESMADWYAEWVTAGSLTHELAIATVLALLPAVTGEPVLDLGCGEGAMARALAKRGAQVTGVDLSERLLAYARRQEAAASLGIDFRVGDARGLGGLADAGFAGVVANLSLTDIDDLDAVVAAVRRVLRAGSWLVFTIPHPCFATPHANWASAADGRPARLVHGYFDEGGWRSTNPEGVRRVGNWHRTLATYLNTLVDGGFVVSRVLEPAPGPALVAAYPERVEVPLLLAVHASRPA